VLLQFRLGWIVGVCSRKSANISEMNAELVMLTFAAGTFSRGFDGIGAGLGGAAAGMGVETAVFGMVEGQ
jgi:hypothetical protein